jgi:hypothetical protein
MMTAAVCGLVTLAMALLPLSSNLMAQVRESSRAVSDTTADGIVLDHPFSGIKYAREFRMLPDGRMQFIQNGRYPTRIARDIDGRIAMQERDSDDLVPECDHLEQRIPPVCPAWGVFVVNPVAHTLTRWVEGELAAHEAIDSPLSNDHLEEMARATSDMPRVPANFTETGDVSITDLGDQSVEGVQAHGVRLTLHRVTITSGKTVTLTRIHEVWIAPQLKLIVRVIDGDPDGIVSIWGIEKISLSPDPSFFQPPADYEHTRRDSPGSAEEAAADSFEYLRTWFSK